MSAAARLAVAGVIRAPFRTAVRVLVLAVAVALLGAMLLFVGHSLNTMTGAAVRSVPLDWQGPVGSYRQAQSVAAEVAAQAGIQQAAPAATAPFAGVTHSAAGGHTDAGSGAILAVPPGYLAHIDTFRFLQGTLRPGALVLDQQLAATLQAHIGDIVAITPRPGARPLRFPVSGVGLVTAPDTVFQPLNPLLGPAPAQPPANARSCRWPPSPERSPVSFRQSRRPAPVPRPCQAPRLACSGRCRRRSIRARSLARLPRPTTPPARSPTVWSGRYPARSSSSTTSPIN